MNGLHIFGKAPLSLLAELGIIPESLSSEADSMPFAVLLFEMRTSSGAYDLATIFSFEPIVRRTWTPDIAAMDENSTELMVELPELLDRCGEPADLEIFHKLRKLPEVTAVVSWN